MTDNLELEKTLWQAADKLRNNMDAAEYKHVVLGLIFLKYISDAFDELYEQLKAPKMKQVPTQKTKTNTQPNEFFMYHHKHVGNGYKAEQNYRPLAKTLTMQWMPLKKTIQL
jgi:type I restriction-modification system DNA methylase subunit